MISPPFVSECNRKSVSIDRCDNNGSNTADDGNYNRYRHVDHHLSLSIPGISGFLSFICKNQRSSQARRQTVNKDSRATCHKGTPEQRTENICSFEYPLEEWMSENQRNMGTSQKFFIMWSSPFTIYTRTSRFFKFFGNFFLRFSQELFLSLCIPGQASFLSFLHRKIPDIFLGYRGLGSNTSWWGGSSD